MQDLKEWLKKCEDFRAKIYRCPSNKQTIGYGWNIDDMPISRAAADFILEEHIKIFQSELHHYSWYRNQPPGVQDALVNMAFNMGINRLVCFTKMIAALNRHDYTTAAKEALDSRWATQVGQRAKDVALMIREGK
ncbi:glycoside hydrolase family protein [Thiocapsa sp. N5-Cardenillas]|uniref:glycoside hydrolase family protein n=1 Tax=Thiocapsa sp. N5-Cardenillas TaxID=3137397 RepID=UPI0035B0A3F1